MEEMVQRISVLSCLGLWKNGGTKRVTASETHFVSNCLAMGSSRAGTIRRASTTPATDVGSRYPCPSTVVALVVMAALVETIHLPAVLARLLLMLLEAAPLEVWSADLWAASVQ